MILGLKGKIQEIHKELQAARSGNKLLKDKLSSKRDVSLSEYLSAYFPDGNDKNGIFEMGHLYNELGINPSVMTISQLIDLDQDSRWLVPEIFRDAIRKGIRTSPFYPNLVIGNESVAQPQVNMPSIDLSDAEPAETNEGEDPNKGSISYDYKTVNITKQMIDLEITYEAIQYSTINLLSIFLQDVGVKFGLKLNNSLVNVAINGDQDDGSEAAAVVGIENTTTGILFKDLLYSWIRGSRLGRLYSAMIAGERMANKILNLSEFKEKQAGTPQQNISVNELLPNQSQLYVSSQVPDNQVILVDPRFAFVQLTSAPLLIEGDQLIGKQIKETTVSITTGFANVFRDARHVIDASLTNAYSGGSNDFPEFMTPTL